MKHILVVDEEPAIGRMLSVILQKDGHRVLPVTSCEAAIDALRGCQFEVVLADSLALCAYVRCEWPKAKVIFATRTIELRTTPARPPSPSEDRGDELYADVVLLKPFRLVDLRRAIGAPARRPTRHPARQGALMPRTGGRDPAMARQDCPGQPA